MKREKKQFRKFKRGESEKNRGDNKDKIDCSISKHPQAS